MKRQIGLFLFLVLVAAQAAAAQSVAQRRAERLASGVNLTYLDNWWLGTKEKKYADFVNPADAARREKMFADIARAGFKTVRIPVNFGAWANYEKPYGWTAEENLKIVDAFVARALENNLNAIVDLHHVEFDGKVDDRAATTERVVWLWRQIAARYRTLDPERVFFELRNEPHDIKAEDWRAQAEAVIKAVREIAPAHTLVVGFHDWNSRAALVSSKPFKDENVIYTFHYYDPFIFTHQGATWAGEGLAELKGVPFPASAEKAIETPSTAKGKWVEEQIKTYARDATAEKIYADLKQAKDWSEKHRVPIFLGEFGSFTKYAAPADRCRHAEAVYAALGRLSIPHAWGEWDQGFNMFEPGTTRIADCMRRALDAFGAKK